MTDVDNARLEGADIGVIVAYFAIVMVFGIVSSLRNRGSVGGYFLAGRSMHWIPVGASLFASNIGSGHFIGLAGSGAASGIGIAAFELNALFVLLILGWVFVPVYMSSGVYTMPEYLRKRFGGQRIRVYLAVMALLLSIFTKVAADLFAGAIFIEQSLRWNLYAAIVLLLALSALFTITGGLTAVIWTDFIQTVIMLGGAFALMIVGVLRTGGWELIKYKYMRAIPNTNNSDETCGVPPNNALHLFRSATDGTYPWPGVVFGLTVSSVWYWCSDQVIVQRALASKDLSHAKGGCILAGYLKVLPMWLLVVPGMIARILFTDTVACADPDTCQRVCNQRSGCTNIAYPTLVLELMPVGAKGLMLAVMMAALMSSLTSIFNSSSTLFTIDIWRRIRKNSSDMELMIVGRVFVLFMVAVGIIWIPIVRNFAELFHYIQSITSYLAPPVCAIYVLAVFWPRCNEKGAFWSLMVGLVVGLTRFIWEFSYTRPACGEPDHRPAIIKDVHYLHFGILLWGLTTIVAIIISLVTEPMPDETLPRLTFWSRYSKRPRINIYDYNKKKREEEEMKKRAEDENYEMKTGKKHGIDGPAAEPGNDTTDTPASSGGAFSTDNYDSFPWYKKAAFWICGIEKSKEPELSDEEKAALEAKQTSLEEKPLWKRVVTINALILMVVAIFMWGFFA